MGISKRFAGIAALIDVSVTVERGECVALIGPNGAGKSTLFNCMAGVTRPDRGIVRFDGHDLGRMPPYRRARLGLARTFQQIELFPGLTVLDHVVVSVRSERRAGGLLRDLTGRSRPTSDELDRVPAPSWTWSGLAGDADRQVDLAQPRPGAGRRAGPGAGARAEAALPRRAVLGARRRRDRRHGAW